MNLQFAKISTISMKHSKTSYDCHLVKMQFDFAIIRKSSCYDDLSGMSRVTGMQSDLISKMACGLFTSNKMILFNIITYKVALQK